jgi:hypothetical protein
MAGVIQIPNQRPSILADFLTRRLQEQTAQQQAQAEQQRNDILKQQVTGQQTLATDAAQEAIAKAQADAFRQNQGQAYHDDPAGVQPLAIQFAQQNPRAAKYIPDLIQGRPQTGGDLLSQATEKGKLTAINSANSGTQDAQARNAAFMQMFGQQLQPAQFADQVQKQTTQPGLVTPGTPYAQTVDIAGKRAPDANQISQNQSAKDVANIQGQTARATTGMQLAAEAPLRSAQAGMYTAEGRKAAAEASIAQAKQAMMQGSPGAPNAFAQGVLQNPQSFFALPTEEKMMATAGLGGKAPKKLTDYETRRMDAAQNGASILNDVKTTADKWAARGFPITGPVIGRYNKAQGVWGGQILPSNLPPQYKQEYLSDISSIQENLAANVLQEAASIVGSRPAYQIVELLQDTGPDMRKGGAMFQGSVNNMLHRYQVAYDQIDKKQWGGAPPQQSGGAKVTTVPAQKDPLGILQ